MATFSVDSSRHFYVVKANKASALSAVGDIVVSGINGDEIFFKYQSPGGKTRTDLVNIKNITNCTSSKFRNILSPVQKITFDTTVIPVVGAAYTINLINRGQYVGGMEYNELKTATVVATTTVVNDLAAAFKTELANAISKDPAMGNVEITVATNVITIAQTAPKFVLGVTQSRYLDIIPQCNPVTISNVSKAFATVTFTIDAATAKYSTPNGRTVADMEWFYMGERGDQYRMAGYPHNFNVQYVADATLNYDFIEIEYFWAGDAEDVQRSKKQLTLAVVSEKTDGTLGTQTLAIVAAMTALGVTPKAK